MYLLMYVCQSNDRIQITSVNIPVRKICLTRLNRSVVSIQRRHINTQNIYERTHKRAHVHYSLIDFKCEMHHALLWNNNYCPRDAQSEIFRVRPFEVRYWWSSILGSLCGGIFAQIPFIDSILITRDFRLKKRKYRSIMMNRGLRW